jgi:phosphomannomutase
LIGEGKVAPDELHRRAEAWLEGDPDEATRAELAALLAGGDDAELAERFGRHLEFGTAGLRGLLGAGPNRMNRAVVIRTSLGFVRYLLGQIPDASDRGVVIGYDARRMSRTFAEDAAGVLAAAGVRVHWFDHVVPTPLVAFAVGALGAAGGIVITASHNPAAYNGYKIYWANGAQIVAPHDEGIAAAIREAPPASLVPRESMDGARAEGHVVDLSDDIETGYVEVVRRLMLSPQVRPSLSVVYTPLHGVGYPLLDRSMTAAGFESVWAVPEQVAPDPAFPTTPFPNPEEKGVLDLALALARRRDADLVLANDPDADRLAVAVKNDRGEFVQLSGNQVGVLLGHYWLTEERRGGERAVIATIVSSPMLGEIARHLGVHYEETLTGFKWIATRALELENQGKRFVFGYEEALGYALGDRVRDKDGISAAVLFAELASVCKARGTTVFAYLSSLYRRFGYHASMQKSITLEGTEGALCIARMMSDLRSSPPDHIAGRRIVERRDYSARLRTSFDGQSEPLSLPASNVLAYELEGHGRVMVRPSGTEPKLKFYLDHRETVAPEEPLQHAVDRAARELAHLEQALRTLTAGI